MVGGNVEIQMIDRGVSSEVVLTFTTDCRHWTHFKANTLEGALRRTIEKLSYPHKDYIEEDGTVWKASEDSVYDANHILSFLANSRRSKK